MTQFKLLEYSIYRNSIMYVFDTLSSKLNWNGMGHSVGRMMLKDSLQKCSEEDAKLYLKLMYDKIGESLGCKKVFNEH